MARVGASSLERPHHLEGIDDGVKRMKQAQHRHADMGAVSKGDSRVRGGRRGQLQYRTIQKYLAGSPLRSIQFISL